MDGDFPSETVLPGEPQGCLLPRVSLPARVPGLRGHSARVPTDRRPGTSAHKSVLHACKEFLTCPSQQPFEAGTLNPIYSGRNRGTNEISDFPKVAVSVVIVSVLIRIIRIIIIKESTSISTHTNSIFPRNYIYFRNQCTCVLDDSLLLDHVKLFTDR